MVASIRLSLLVLLAAALAPAPAHALDADPMQVCQSAAAGADFACKAIIDSPGAAADARAVAHLRLAWVLGRDGANAQALRHADAAVGLAPKWFVAYNERAVVHLRAKRYGAAVADYGRALALNPQAVYSLYGRGLARGGLGQAQAAEADFAAARRLQADIDAVFKGFGL